MKNNIAVMVRFTCSRCGKEHVEPIERNRFKHGNNIFMYDPPEGWKRNETVTPMLCDECNKKLQGVIMG